MTVDDIRATVTEALAGFNRAGDGEAFLAAYDPEVRLHGYPGGLEGLEGLRQFHLALWEAFPDAEVAIEDLVVDGDRAALRYRLRGTHRRVYLGVAATGLTIDVEGLTMLRVSGGRVIEEWHSPTELSILRQLGAVRTNVVLDEPRGGTPRRSASAEAAALRWEERRGQ
jgi:predicted ester cyclase